MENTPSISDPATPASEAAFTTSLSLTSDNGQTLVDAGTTQETEIQLHAADNPPTVVRATANEHAARTILNAVKAGDARALAALLF